MGAAQVTDVEVDFLLLARGWNLRTIFQILEILLSFLVGFVNTHRSRAISSG